MEILVGVVLAALFIWGATIYDKWVYERKMRRLWQENQRKYRSEF